MHTQVHSTKAVGTLKRQAANSISEIATKIENQDTHVLFGDTLQTLDWTDAFRILVEGLECQQAYRNLILNSAYVINSNCQPAVAIYLSTLQALLSDPNSSTNDFEQKIKHFYSNNRQRRVSSRIVTNSWKRSITNDVLWDNREIIIKACGLAGAMGSIKVQKTTDSNASIEIRNGLKVNCHLSQGFKAATGQLRDLSNVSIVMFDGIVTEVSELHRILTDAHDKKINVAIFASGYSSDVENTLTVNWKSGKLRVVPFVMEDKLDDVNQVRDVCEPLGVLPVSKDTGRLLSSIDLEEERSVEKIRVSTDAESVIITPQKEQLVSIIKMRSDIAGKLAKANVEDVRNILKKRLTKFSSRMVTLSIPCRQSEEGIIQDRVGSFFKFMSQCAFQGVYDTKKIEKVFPLLSGKKLPDVMPAAAVARAINRAISDSKTISNIGCIISLDDKG